MVQCKFLEQLKIDDPIKLVLNLKIDRNYQHYKNHEISIYEVPVDKKIIGNIESFECPDIIIKTKDGNLDCRFFISNIEKNPSVIFYMDAPGIREELREMCRRITHNGYNVILPNLFYRKGTECNYPFDQRDYKKNKNELKKMIKTMNETSK